MINLPNFRGAIAPNIVSTPPSGGDDVIATTNLVLDINPNTFPGLSNGDPVSQLLDSSGGSRHSAVQSTSDARAAYRTALANGRAGLEFNNNHNYIFSSLPLTSAVEVFLVIKMKDDPPTLANGLWTYVGGSGASGSAIPFSNGLLYEGFGSTTRKDGISKSISLSTAYRLYNISSIANEWICRLDKTVLLNATTNTFGWESNWYFGRNNPSHWTPSYVMRLLLYSAKLSSTNKAINEAALKTAYNLSYS